MIVIRKTGPASKLGRRSEPVEQCAEAPGGTYAGARACGKTMRLEDLILRRADHGEHDIRVLRSGI